MNHCGASEEETTSAIKSLHVTEANNAEKNYQLLASGSINILVGASKSMRSITHMFLK